jgi:gas vesicle protein
MATSEGSSTKNTLLAFAIGALAGAAVALLYAPASGAETRRKLKDKARAGRDRVSELADEGREFVKRQRENVEAAVEHGREVFERARKEKV